MSSSNKPAIAQRLEAESAAMLAKREALNSDKLEEEHKAAEERRQAALQEKVEKAKELEGKPKKQGE